MDMIKKFLWRIVSSSPRDNLNAGNVLERQRRLLKEVWQGDKYNDFGIERILRLILVLLTFTGLGLYIRNYFQGKNMGLKRKLAIDSYVVFQIAFPLITLFEGWYRSRIIVLVCAFMGFETLVALMSMSFLTPNIPTAISNRRNHLLLFLNFLQFVALFAVFYMYCGDNAFAPTDQCAFLPMTPVKALYMSLETFTTVGFGDMIPNTNLGYRILIIQMLVSLLFIYIFFSIFAAKMSAPTFYNPDKEKHEQFPKQRKF